MLRGIHINRQSNLLSVNCFLDPQVCYEFWDNPTYNINRFVLQEVGKVVEGCLTCEELSGSYSQDIISQVS